MQFILVKKAGSGVEYLDDVSLSNGLGLFVPLFHFVVTNELVGGLLTVLSSTHWRMSGVSSLPLETFRVHRGTLNAWVAVCCGPSHVGSFVD